MGKIIVTDELKAVIGELLGTLLLALTVGIASQVTISSLYIPALIGGVVALMVYWLGGLSGAQLNPAVTLGLMGIRQIPVALGIIYMVAQVLGAYLGLALAFYFTKYWPTFVLPHDAHAFWAELVGAAILVFTVSKAVLGQLPMGMQGLIIGGALALGISLASPVSGGILNPVLSLNLHLLDVAHLLAPLFGGILGATAAYYLSPSKR
jgi:aquaporin Z